MAVYHEGSSIGSQAPKLKITDRALLTFIGHQLSRLPDEVCKPTDEGYFSAKTSNGRTTITHETGHKQRGSIVDTTVVVDRDPHCPSRISYVTADRATDEDVSTLYGLSESHETYALGNPANQLSLFEVATIVHGAVKALARAPQV